MKSSQLSFYLHHIFMDVEVKFHVHFCYIDINSLLPNIQFVKTNYCKYEICKISLLLIKT